jgi:hypothetical protein
MGCVPREKRSPTIKKRIFLGDPQEGGVTLLGGRTIWGRGKGMEAINEVKGSGEALG